MNHYTIDQTYGSDAYYDKEHKVDIQNNWDRHNAWSNGKLSDYKKHYDTYFKLSDPKHHRNVKFLNKRQNEIKKEYSKRFPFLKHNLDVPEDKTKHNLFSYGPFEANKIRKLHTFTPDDAWSYNDLTVDQQRRFCKRKD